MSNIYKALTACLLYVIGIFTAQAAEQVKNYGAMELDKAYEVNASYQYVSGYYTATQTGVLTVTSSNTDIFVPYSDEECQTAIPIKRLNANLPNYHVYYTINVTEGQTIYFRYTGLNSGTNTLSFSTDNSIKYTGSSVEAGKTIMCTATSQLSFGFNRTVDCRKVELVVGEESKAIAFNTGSNSIYFEVKQVIYNLMKSGKLKEGDKFSFRISGICEDGNSENLYNTDGVLTIDYICGAKPVSLVSATNFTTDHKFRSFWPKGDADGIITLTFDGNIKVGKESVSLTYADNTSGSEASAKYTETPPFTVNGKQLVIDLTDKERTPQTMLENNTIYERMLLSVSHVCDEAGNPVYTEVSGSRGSFTRSMPYGIETVNANTQITPASGSTLGNTENIEIFVTDYKKFSFTGVKFIYTDAKSNAPNTITVAKDQCTETADDDIAGAYSLVVPVPAEVRGQKDIYMSLANLKAADGKDYNALFTAKYNGFTVLDMTYQASADAAPISLSGASLDKFIEEAPIVITTNLDEVTGNDSLSYVSYEVIDLNPAEGDDPYIVTPTHIERTEGTTNWIGEVVGATDTKFYIGHTYRIVVTGYQQLGKNFNPYRDLVVGTDTLYFTGSQPDYEYSDITLESYTPDDNTINSTDEFKLTLNFDGLVKILPDETGVAGGMGSNFQPFSKCEAIDAQDEGYASQWVLTMDAETAKGLDTRFIEINIAAIDQDEHRVKGNSGNRETTITVLQFTLNYNGAELTVVPTQGEAEEYESLYQFDVTTPNVITMGSVDLSEAHVFNMLNTIDVPVVSAVPVYEDELTQEIMDYIENNSYEEAVAKYGQQATDKAYFATTNTMRLTLEHAITDEGGYTFVIPAEYFNSGEQFDGEVSKAYEGFFIVKGSSEPIKVNYTTDPANGSTVKSLGEITIVFPDYAEDGVALGNGMIVIKKYGTQIDRVDAIPDDIDYNKFSIPVNQTEQGIYTIEIPEGYFVNPDGDNIPAITLEYGINEATGINNAQVNASAQSQATYTLSGVRVNGKLPAGVYIKAGKKVIIK